MRYYLSFFRWWTFVDSTRCDVAKRCGRLIYVICCWVCWFVDFIWYPSHNSCSLRCFYRWCVEQTTVPRGQNTREAVKIRSRVVEVVPEFSNQRRVGGKAAVILANTWRIRHFLQVLCGTFAHNFNTFPLIVSRICLAPCESRRQYYPIRSHISAERHLKLHASCNYFVPLATSTNWQK